MSSEGILSPDLLIGDEPDKAKRAQKWEAYLESLKSSLGLSDQGMIQLSANFGMNSGGQVMGEGRMIEKVSTGLSRLEDSIASPALMKGVDPAVLESIKVQIEQAKSVQADLAKDFTLTSPLSTGFVPFDLEAPSKHLTPRPTPLRNRIARVSGQGTSRRYKRLTGFTGTGTGGVGNTWPGITDTSTATFGSSLTLNRGPKISYASDEKTIPYKQFSLSDSVPWSAQFSGQGFEDIRQLSQTSVLYSSMLMEERMLLGARGTDSGFSGALAAPTSLSATARAAAPGEVGLTAGRYWIKVTTEGQFGESVLSASLNIDNVTSGQVVDITGTIPGGGLGMRVYAAQVAAAGADPGDTAKFFQGRTGYKTFSLGAASNVITTGVAASTITADTTAYATGYDGILSYLGDSTQSGYLIRLDAPFSSSNPGAEYQTAFASLYNSVKADPDEILFNGSDRKQLSDLLKTASSSNYRLTVSQSEIGGVTIGDVITAIQNEVTGKVVQMTVHPWLVQGNTPILSWTLPIPDTNVGNVFQVVNVQDYMSVQWPVVQFSYDVSSYWYGALICYAPAWCGLIQGIKQV